MPQLFSVQFDWSDWRPVRKGTHEVAWQTRAGDSASLHFYEMRPDLPTALSKIEEVRHYYRSVVTQEGGGLISADVVQLGGVDAVKLVLKYRQAPGTRAVKNIGTLALMFADCNWVFRVESVEKGAIGMRESTAFTDLRRSLGPEVPVPQSEWARDPYDPEFPAPFSRNRSDDERWDEHFPDHPLSKVRALLAHFEQTLELDPELQKLAPFQR